MTNKVILDPDAKELANSSAKRPYVFELPLEQGRKALEDAQSTNVYKYPACVKKICLNLNELGSFNVYVVTPPNLGCKPGIIYYIHGAGWVFGSFHTHEKLVRELAYRTNSVLIFPEYTRSPEVRFPVAVNQCYEILCGIPKILSYCGIKADICNITVAGDSVGGNLAIAMTLLSKYNDEPKLSKQLLYYPVTDSNFYTNSYLEFQSGYYLYRDGMKWFWDKYATEQIDRNNVLASPLKASEEQLKGLPDAMIINGEVDVLRDEGEAYANKLKEAGVDVTAVRFQGMVHDFVMLNSLDRTNATRAAMDVSTDWINRKNILYCD